MADSNVTVTPGTGVSFDTRTQADGDHRQVMNLGDANAAYTQTVRSNGEAAVGYGRATATGSITNGDTGTTTLSVNGGISSVYTGTPTAGSFVSLAVDGQSSFALQVTGSRSMTIYFERSYDGGTTWVSAPMYAQGTDTNPLAANNRSAYSLYAYTPASGGPGVFFGDCAGASHVRARVPNGSFSSGPATILLVATSAPGPHAVIATTSPAFVTQSSSRTGIAASTTSQSLSNGGTNPRQALLIYNDSSALLYVNLNAAASTTVFSFIIQPGGYWECPVPYAGTVYGVWSAAVGAARVTELY